MCVPEELDHQCHVHADIVARDHDLPSCLSGEQSTDQVTRVTSTPNDQEKDRQSGR
jgi:hypothetical protein